MNRDSPLIVMIVDVEWIISTPRTTDLRHILSVKIPFIHKKHRRHKRRKCCTYTYWRISDILASFHRVISNTPTLSVKPIVFA